MNAGARADRIVWRIAALAGAIAVFLRIDGLTDKPFWLDEAYSAFAAEKGFAFIANVLPGYETHPPFYSALLRGWSLVAGQSLGSYRAFGAVTGVLTLSVMWFAARELSALLRRSAASIALPALVFAAVLPTFVEVSRTVRPYSLLVLTSACACWAILRLAREDREEGTLHRGAWLTYLACQILFVWLHNLGALYVAANGLFLLAVMSPARMIRDHGKPFVIGHVAVAALALPAILILADQAPTWAQSTWLRFRPENLFGDVVTLFGLPGLLGLVIAALLGGWALAGADAAGRRVLSGLLIAALVPPLLALGLTLLFAPVFLPRTLVASAAPLLLVLAAGADRRLVARAATAALAITALIRAVQLQALPPEQDWYGVIAWLSPRIQPGDRIYAYPNEGALPLRFALRDKGLSIVVRPIPGDVPARDPAGWYPTGSRGVQSLPPWRLAQIASDRESQATPTLWLLRLRQSSYDADDSAVRAFSVGRHEVTRYRYNDIEIRGLRRSAEAPAPQKAQP
jgi:mannosyltransferase